MKKETVPLKYYDYWFNLTYFCKKELIAFENQHFRIDNCAFGYVIRIQCSYDFVSLHITEGLYLVLRIFQLKKKDMYICCVELYKVGS